MTALETRIEGPGIADVRELPTPTSRGHGIQSSYQTRRSDGWRDRR